MLDVHPGDLWQLIWCVKWSVPLRVGLHNAMQGGGLMEGCCVFERVLQRKRLLETGPGYESRAERIRKAIESKMVSFDEEDMCC